MRFLPAKDLYRASEKNPGPIKILMLKAYRGDEEIDHAAGKDLFFQGVISPVLKESSILVPFRFR